MMTTQPTSPFAPTRWTLVLRASGDSEESKAALSELCEAYYQPVFRFLRREGRKEDEARELTQEFFARVLTRGDLRADPERGRFRSYILGAVKHFLADERKAVHREKRGGGQEDLRLDADEGPTSVVDKPAEAATGDTWFDRQWALAVMERGLAGVEAEFQAAGKARQFEVLKPWLIGESEELSQAEAAKQLNWTETAVKVSVHRLRKRFRETIRSEVSQTVSDGTDLDVELRYLVDVLARS